MTQPAAGASGVATAQSTPAGPSVVIEEKPLRVYFQLDFVKPKTAGDVAPKKVAKAPSADAPAADAGAAAPAADAPANSEQN